jgi:hypothetical protein
MTEYCNNHPMTEAFSVCHNCGKHFCEECLSEGEEYYHCYAPECQTANQKEKESGQEITCPSCSSVLLLDDDELRKKSFRCPECDVLIKLVNGIPEPVQQNEYELLLSSANQGDIALIQSILDDSQIDYYITGEGSMALQFGKAMVYVCTSQLEQSKELLKEIDLHLFIFSDRNSTDEEQ